MTDMKQLIHYATMAPSGHNTQPWKFRIQQQMICICPDLSRRLPVV
ncbi:MAG: nitroreductase family protein, partial [Methanomethylovorans sp.]|nr:nitroreductase family protein [Methanomethylovorans sp.]